MSVVKSATAAAAAAGMAMAVAMRSAGGFNLILKHKNREGDPISVTSITTTTTIIISSTVASFLGLMQAAAAAVVCIIAHEVGREAKSIRAMIAQLERQANQCARDEGPSGSKTAALTASQPASQQQSANQRKTIFQAITRFGSRRPNRPTEFSNCISAASA